MADKNKVLFGFSELYIGTYEVDDQGNVTLGTPYHQKGAVGFSPEASNEEVDFYADNIDYWSEQNAGPRSGDLEVAKFDDEAKVKFFGYKRTGSGGIGEVINPVKPNIYILFQIDGDKENVRRAMYNGVLGGINREYSTTEASREPVTETAPVKFVGDVASGLITDSCKPGDAGYDTYFTNPVVPSVDSES